jgi:hypothetical protein
MMTAPTPKPESSAAESAADDEIERKLMKPSMAPALAEVAAGFAAGAAVGAIAGPPGMAAGALIGSVLGAAASFALDEDAEKRGVRDAELDQDIGVYGGDLGEAKADAPPAKIGAFHAASLGMGGGGGSETSDGPMQNVDEG